MIKLVDNERIKDSMLTSNILQCIKVADIVSNIDKWGLIQNYFSFLDKWKWWIVCLMPIFLLMNGGLIVDIIIIIIIILSLIGGKYYLECCNIYMQFYFLGESSYSWGSFTSAENTIKEINYLIPKLKECEKITDLNKRYASYNLLVEEMDLKYGKNNHMLGHSHTREDELNHKKQITIEEARIDFYEDFKEFVDSIKEYMNICNTEDFAFDTDIYYQFISRLKGTRNWCPRFSSDSFKNNNLRNVYDEEYKKLYYHYVGDDISFCAKEERFGLGSLMQLYINRICYKRKTYKNYYSINDTTSLEGKITYELIEELKPIIDIGFLFPQLNETLYKELCKAVEINNYTFEDLISGYFTRSEAIE